MRKTPKQRQECLGDYMSPFDVAWTFLKHDNITKFNLSNWFTGQLAGFTAGYNKPVGAARGPVIGSEDWYSQNRPRGLNYDMSDYRDRGYDIDNRPYGYTPSSPFEYNTGSDLDVEGPEVQDDGRVIYGGGTAYSDDAADYSKITESRKLLADEEAYQQRLEEERQLQEEERKRAEQEQAEQQQQQHDGTMPGGGVTVI